MAAAVPTPILELEPGSRRSHPGTEPNPSYTTHDGQEGTIEESRMLQGQKLECLGLLAGGIAHDFNNLLTPILGYASLLPSYLSPESPARMMVQQIEQAARRAAGLAQQMLAYSGRGRFNVQPIQLSQLVQEMSELVQAGLSKKARLQMNLAGQLPTVEVDVAQIQQVVLNLLTNASDALEDGSGIIAVNTSVRYLKVSDLRGAVLPDPLPAGEYVVLQVRDTGCGMSPETIERIFDPFFTTKNTGRGLGLCAVLGIVRGHGGALRVESERGRGTTFELLLPVSGKAVAQAKPEQQPTQPTKDSGHILIVEDEAAVRNLLERVLKSQGFRVTVAADGNAGLEIFKELADDLDAVVLDMAMPGYTGSELLPKLRAIKPGVSVVMMSGFSPCEVRATVAGVDRIQFVSKPFRPGELIQALARLRDAEG